ncbi:MAG: riboflavin synthase [Melioribacteraceae bacterium]|nr:riboflavin synthase [Melioribacteraceae bacterium]
MFTGLIEEVGKVVSIRPIAGGKKLKISANTVLENSKVDDSIAVNGVCLTVTEIDKNAFWADTVGETLNKTTLKNITVNANVNLERALRLSDRLGGHLVLGHVNGIGTITNITKLGDNYDLEIDVPSHLDKYLIDEGSITIDGISLTIAKVNYNKINISVIPHTWQKTVLMTKQTGSTVNLETDVLAKYIEKLISANKPEDQKFSAEWFNKLGY